MTYELYYWDGIQGRGEFVRLALEDAGAPYVDVTREPGRGTGEMLRLMQGDGTHVPFAPPFLKHGTLIVSHVANILFYLGPKLGLAPQDETTRWFANGLQLTVTDFVAEVHDTHHPIATSKYYEEQKAEAKAEENGSRERDEGDEKRYAEAFRDGAEDDAIPLLREGGSQDPGAERHDGDEPPRDPFVPCCLLLRGAHRGNPFYT